LAATPVAQGELAGLSLLLGPLATTSGLREAIARGVGATTAAGDTLLVYFAGHGRRGQADGLVLLSADGEYPATQLVEDCGTDAEPIAVILDCCHAGAVAASKRAVTEEDRRDRMMKFHLGQLQFLCSSTAEQTAAERDGRGVFTQRLVEALGAPHDPPLLGLPMVVSEWCYALPKELLDQYEVVEHGRDVLPAGAAEATTPPPPPRQTYVTEAEAPGDPDAAAWPSEPDPAGGGQAPAQSAVAPNAPAAEPVSRARSRRGRRARTRASGGPT
jgi:hypothetical protein